MHSGRPGSRQATTYFSLPLAILSTNFSRVTRTPANQYCSTRKARECWVWTPRLTRPSPSALRVVIRKQPCSRTALPRAKAEQPWSFTPTYEGRRAQTPASNSRKRLETSACNDNCRHQDAHCSIPEKPQRRRKPPLVSAQRPYRRVSGLHLRPFSRCSVPLNRYREVLCTPFKDSKS